ncbi:hypothetical protein GNZ12_10680 [Paraburkholderia sp. 1N]|uniref:Uncharacterized protein n=1 Tax=Paraburkholderia solitsugae TaxID=2675748 RepID=A0ABX2BM93_9BURK|nr:hypothetical protein [Paraburkholderia solitsugae]NPT41774.1 hypothetical protein [Paraburkholderia solitsugae]
MPDSPLRCPAVTPSACSPAGSQSSCGAPERFAVFLYGKMAAGLRRAFVEAADAVKAQRQD